MRIGIDCRMWSETGVGRYIRNIVVELAKMDNRNTYILFMLSDDIKGLDLPSNFIKVPADIRWHTFAEQLVLPFIFYKQNLDLLHVPHFNVPILYFKKFIATIHDLTILRIMTGRATTLPYPLYFLKSLAFKLVMFNTVHRAKRIFTVSNFVRHDIMTTYGVSPVKILLTPCAVNSNFHRVMLGDIIPIFQKYNVQQPYIFYIGNAHPHKNVEGLIKAFEVLNKQIPDLTLVLGGSKKFFYERIEKEWSLKKVSQKIKFIGYVEDGDLPALYSGAEAFVNASFYEGFGIQILEAFACGTKVACSETSSLPEVAGGGAYLFNPGDTHDMVEKIKLTLNDTTGEKVEIGYKHVAEYSWNSSARKVLGVYEDSRSL